MSNSLEKGRVPNGSDSEIVEFIEEVDCFVVADDSVGDALKCQPSVADTAQ